MQQQKTVRNGEGIAHRLRACDAAALEPDRPTSYYHRATVLQTAAPLRHRPDRPCHATRTLPAEVSEIATDSIVALPLDMPLDMNSTPPAITCA
jgi:hypothetical protein